MLDAAKSILFLTIAYIGPKKTKYDGYYTGQTFVRGVPLQVSAHHGNQLLTRHDDLFVDVNSDRWKAFEAGEDVYTPPVLVTTQHDSLEDRRAQVLALLNADLEKCTTKERLGDHAIVHQLNVSFADMTNPTLKQMREHILAVYGEYLTANPERIDAVLKG